jgi:hypothetical protein
MAIVSLVASILGWTLVPLIGAIVGVITGHMAKKEIRDSNGALTGDGLATAGLVIGYIELALVACAVCGLIAFLAITVISTGTTNFNY